LAITEGYVPVKHLQTNPLPVKISKIATVL